MSTLTETDKKIIKAYADNDMKRNNTAAALFYNPNTVDYHITRIHKKTGLNPRKFYDLNELLKKCGEDDG